MTRIAAIALAAMLGAASPAIAAHHAVKEVQEPAVAAVDPALLDVLADARRDDDRARDAYRHPAETLTFFGVKLGMTVVDYMPSRGWYTRVLAPYLADTGHYIGLNPDVRAASEKLKNYFGDLAASFPEKAAGWSGQPANAIAAYNTDILPEEMNGTVDRVLIFREMHNLHRFGFLYRELTAMRGLLKDDGLLGVVQHRAKPDASATYTDGHKGYLREGDVIGLIEAHGFELVGKSEINANPADSADYSEGVWELPPVQRTKRAELAPIGESDRMTLLFRKRP